MDVITVALCLFGIGALIAGLPALAWGLVLILKNPDRKSRTDGTVSIGGGVAAMAAGLGVLSWVAL